jgi:hypothetical protein
VLAYCATGVTNPWPNATTGYGPFATSTALPDAAATAG